MIHVFFIMLHIFTLLFFFPGLLLTIPLHLWLAAK